MNIIETIKAEIERLKNANAKLGHTNSIERYEECAYGNACDTILSFLDTLQEQPVDTSEDERINTAIFKALSKKDARDVLKECGVEVGDALDYLKRQSKEQPVCEGLDEEISNYIEKHFGESWDGCVPVGCFELDKMAHHFAQWGAEHLKK